MSIQDLGSIGELLAAVATIATLIYFAKQIKYSSAVSKTTSYHMAIDQIVQCAKERDFSDLMTKIEKGNILTDEEDTRASSLSAGFIYGHEILLHLYKQGQVEDEMWENLLENNAAALESPMVFPILKERNGPLSKELLALLQQRKSSTKQNNQRH